MIVHDSHESAGASNSLVITLKICDEHKNLSIVMGVIGSFEASIIDMKMGHQEGCQICDITINIDSPRHGEELVIALKALSQVEVLGVDDLTMHVHRGGKLKVVPTCPLETRADLARAYSPGIRRPIDVIHKDPSRAWDLTTIGNRVGIFSNATRLLNLGHRTPQEAMVVLEGKAAISAKFGGFSMWPMPLPMLDPQAIIRHIQEIGDTYAGFVLEDIKSPDCWIILDELRKTLPCFVFHDDADGTAVVVTAATINAAKFLGKKLEDMTVVASGTGAAGSACIKLLLAAGVRNIIGFNAGGAVHKGRSDLSSREQWLVQHTNLQHFTGAVTVQQALRGADMFLGLAASNILKGSDLAVMNRNPIVFALSNPDPEVNVKDARVYMDQLGGGILATGSSEDINQINNSNAFPGILRGAIDIRAREFTPETLLAAALGMASMIPDSELRADHIIVNPEDNPEVHEIVANAIRRTGPLGQVIRT